MNFQGLYNIRLGTKNDHNFVLATFLRGLYYGNTFFNKIPKDIFMNKYKLVAQALLASPDTKLIVACLPDEPDVILGYNLTNKVEDTIYFVFIKKAWRRRGIAKSLVPPNPKYISHLTSLGEDLLSKFETKPQFNPFI